ncbi:MAG: hypothetical protein A2942_04300 [Candidatus Lloydbacteria bacterium RIFCSPLOWO2_01_FULL_50_20]|uniref:Uncharacterized protein n=1 Tax=Candidatus Lloydbacteria bacterium RIFCSPLOWO2_01_FULL_50_20 TaxID=1798665 RepID=A0A1G2DEY8_9BACT|nr:MAG: hypothetical protein A3C13_04505 [Candidatus Lloydbacteria bacterium RIFCSPHIGHO2_02_FULL_50_11]OGZ11440.1 MAG: hypothetical protein A2942_04300 [Candidatus Lloydbacteria bacterium RIFCSPLOWO2_01_FULL_50_20]
MGHKFVPITESLFQKYFEGNDDHAYIAEKDMPRKFKRTIEEIARKNGGLFVSETFIITERLSPLAIRAVERIAKRAGYSAECKNIGKQLRYPPLRFWRSLFDGFL